MGNVTATVKTRHKGNKKYTEGGVILNKEGEIEFIENNIFYKNVDNDQAKDCALWILQNEHKVKKRIRNTFSSMGHADAELDECYDYMVYYFMEFQQNAFDEDYFTNQEMIKTLEMVEDTEDIDELDKLEHDMESMESSEYKMEYYLMNRVRHCALGYIRELNKSRDILRYNEDDLDEGSQKNSNTISMDLASAKIKDQEVNIEESPGDFIEFSDLQDKFDNELYIYDEEFQQKGLKDFSMKKFVQALFLKGFQDEIEMAEYMGVTPAVVNNYKSGFKKIVENETGPGGEYCDLFETIQELIAAMHAGWTPEFED